MLLTQFFVTDTNMNARRQDNRGMLNLKKSSSYHISFILNPTNVLSDS